jgi:competence protein ComEC
VTRPGTGGWLLPCGLILGSLAAPLCTAVPPIAALLGLAGFGVLFVLVPPVRWLGAILLACCWSFWNYQLRLDDRLPPELSGQVVTLRGVISSMPQDFEDYVSFRFEPLARQFQGGRQLRLPNTLLVRWFKQRPQEPPARAEERVPALSAGEAWRFDLLLKPPWGTVNFQGPDRERWLFANGIGGLATVRDGWPEVAGKGVAGPLARLREAIFHRIEQALPDPRTAGIVQALAVADRSGMGRNERQLLALTGTSHLLAISGLHIGLAAGAGMLLARWVGWLLPFTPPGRALHAFGILGGLLAAAGYAALAGFGVSTVRSLLMLLIAMSAVSASRVIHAGRAWLLAMAAVLLINPFAPLGAGFWFSFMAVASLLWFFAPRCGRRGRWQTLLMAQAAVLLVLLPVSAAWFQAFSWVGFLANLVAIPLVSFGVVPFVLAGVVAFSVSGQVATWLWGIAGAVSGSLLTFLEFMAAIQGELTRLGAPTVGCAVLGVLGAFLLLLPRGIPGRWLGLFLMAPLFLPSDQQADKEDLVLDVLDVGQGTAALLRTAGHTLLYDAGPGDGGGRDLVRSVIAPALGRVSNDGPDRVIISHGDLDHAGGLGSLQARYPRTTFHGNLPRRVNGVASCHVPLAWRWGNTRFTVLHPSGALPYRGNDSSCVLDVNHRRGRLLLSGDITATVETRLLFEGLGPYRVLLVPHHGSLTSSSQAFIRTVDPQIAVTTAGLGNRFGFPKAAVRQRYQDAGIPFWSTGECGALRIVLYGDGGLTATSARLLRPAIWRWPAAPTCPAHLRLL